jgi:hypothetical protein
MPIKLGDEVERDENTLSTINTRMEIFVRLAQSLVAYLVHMIIGTKSRRLFKQSSGSLQYTRGKYTISDKS